MRCIRIPDQAAFGCVKAGSIQRSHTQPVVVKHSGRRQNLETSITFASSPQPLWVSAAQASDQDRSARNPTSASFMSICTNAALPQSPDVRASSPGQLAVIHLIQLPPYCPHLNPMSGFGPSCINYGTTIAYLPKSKAVRRRHPCIHACNHPAVMDKLRDKSQTTSRHNHENFRFEERRLYVKIKRPPPAVPKATTMASLITVNQA